MDGKVVQSLLMSGLIGVGAVAPLPAQSVAVAPVVAAQPPVAHMVTIDVIDAPLKHVLQQIARQAGLTPVYGDGVSRSARRVTLHVSDVSATDAFKRALAGTNLHATQISNNVVFEITPPGLESTAASGDVVGKVTDEKSKQPLRGVSIVLDDSKTAVLTGDDGTFRVTQVASGEHVVHFRHLGYVRTTRSVTVVDGKSATLLVALTPSVNTLDQVVVTGTVVATELKAIPNSITIVTGKQLEEKGVTRIYELFRGNVPGLFTNRTGQVGAAAPGKIGLVSRGGTHLDDGYGVASAEGVKTYVDGVELADKSYLGMIDPKSIERIEILTGPDASTIYGSNAINGVIQIFTKRGTTERPQITATLKSAWTQNNFSSGLAPHHDVGTDLTGMDGHLSYNAGVSWLYDGSWVPAVLGQTVSGYGGGRIKTGPLSTDASVRVMQVRNKAGGNDQQVNFELGASGVGNYLVLALPPDRTVGTTIDNAVGVTENYAMTSWWSHTLTLGFDQLGATNQTLTYNYGSPSDTTSFLGHNTDHRLTAAYNTTVRVPVTSVARLTMTVGIDESHEASEFVGGSYVKTSTGAYDASQTGGFSDFRSSAKEHGGFLQGQLGIWDELFLTYGLRAVYNPNIGVDQNPNLQPRYGVALTQEYGGITVKVRGSYGHSTRPPGVGYTQAIRLIAGPFGTTRVRLYGDTVSQLPNLGLLPEQQQGGEGGLELYLGNRASLTVTRYNKTVDNLIQQAVVDSVDALPAVRVSRGWKPWQVHMPISEYLNLGSIRNQGWEMTGTTNLGAITTTGTYSWNKGRLIGITPRFRKQFPQYVVGSAFATIPEHTYALDVAYVHSKTRIALNLQGQGSAVASDARTVLETTRTNRRLDSDLPLMPFNIPAIYSEVYPGFALANLNVSHRFATWAEGLLDVTNVTDSYKSDIGPTEAQAGRTTSIGMRLRF